MNDKSSVNDKSITVRLISGIGNNLYQIATLYHFAKINNIKNWSVIYPQHDGKIQEIRPNGGHYTKKDDTLPFYIEEIFPNINWKDSADVDDIIIGSYIFSIDSFWGSIIDIRQILTPSEKITNYIQNKYQELYNKPTIGIHLRFLSGADSFLPEKNNFNWIYDILKNESDNFNNIIIVSNNVTLASNFKNNITSFGSVYLIDDEPNFIDLFLLSKCDIIICSNSTFSFWAGALNNNSKVYITPEYKPAGCRESIPHEWNTNRDFFYKTN